MYDEIMTTLSMHGAAVGYLDTVSVLYTALVAVLAGQMNSEVRSIATIGIRDEIEAAVQIQHRRIRQTVAAHHALPPPLARQN